MLHTFAEAIARERGIAIQQEQEQGQGERTEPLAWIAANQDKSGRKSARAVACPTASVSRRRLVSALRSGLLSGPEARMAQC